MNPIQTPPRMLLGCTLLFWGAMCGRPLVGLLAALLVEARHWVRLRWDFDDDACARSWQISTILAAMTGVLLLIDGSRNRALPELLSWLPILMMPVQFVQSYGLRPGIPLGSISYFARRQRLRAQRLGLPIPTGMFHFGNVTFLLCLVAATVGTSAESGLFLPGILILCTWRILTTRITRARVLIPSLALAGIGAVAGDYGIQKLEEYYSFGGSSRETMFNPSFKGTMIGRTGEVSLSPEIKWRLRPINGKVPTLLRTASFSLFNDSSWNAPVNKKNEFVFLENDVVGEETVYRTMHPDPATGVTGGLPTAQVVTLPSFLLRGATKRGDPLPAPGSIAGVSGIELDTMELSKLGTTRLVPKEPVLNAKIYWQGESQPDPPPSEWENMSIPTREREAIRRVARELALDSDVPASVQKISKWFQQEFTYSLQLEIGKSKYNDQTGPISHFLTTHREGHCEYFATAATLLLREAGIPARYTIGFAVIEANPKKREYIIRGTHGHAWVRVWDGKQWLDFDPTPPGWFSSGLPQPGLRQRLTDWIQLVREDFYVWRKVPENQRLITIIMGLIGLGLGSVILIKLWRSRSVDSASRPPVGQEIATSRTALHDLEPVIRRLAGKRPVGEPFATWVGKAVSAIVDQAQLQEILSLHQSIRFDPRGNTETARQRLDALVRSLKAALRESRRD